MIRNTVAYSSKQLFTSNSTELLYRAYTKISQRSTHASFLQCSAYIVLGQDYGFRKINLKISWNHRVIRIRQDKARQILQYHAPAHFLSEAIILTLGDKRQEVYPKNLSTMYLIVWGFKNQQSRWWD